jgi:hypothetical protein
MPMEFINWIQNHRRHLRIYYQQHICTKKCKKIYILNTPS